MDLLQKRQHENVPTCGVVLGYEEVRKRKKTPMAENRSSASSTAKTTVYDLSSVVRAML
jgi:hypothetical protein